MPLLDLLDNDPTGFPSELVDVVKFLVYINVEERFLVQLNQKCLPNARCFGEDDQVQVEL